MTTNYHTAIATGAAANASTFNGPLSTLDTQLTAVSSEVTTARNAYASLGARLDAMVLAGSNVSTLTNGAASAGQKVVTVDSTTGFLAGAPVAYTLVGGAVETNTVGTVDSPTQLTLTTNIGTGGIANDTYIAVTPLGSMSSTGAVPGASSAIQVFVTGVQAGSGTQVEGGAFVATPTVGGSAGWHGFRDETTFDASGDIGYAAFDAQPTMQGANAYNHFVGVQSRPIYTGGGGVTAYLDSVNAVATHSGAGTVALYRGLHVLDIAGAGTVTAAYGVYIEPIQRAATNYAIYAAGGTSYLAGNLGLGATAPASNLEIKKASPTMRLHSTTAGSGDWLHFTGDNSGEKGASLLYYNSASDAGSLKAYGLHAILGANGTAFRFGRATAEAIGGNDASFTPWLTLAPNDSRFVGAVGINSTGAPLGAFEAVLSDATTNAATTVGAFGHNTSGTVANGFGSVFLFRLQSDTTVDQYAAQFVASWYDATHNSRKGDFAIFAYDTAAREGMRIRGLGSEVGLSFYGVTPIARAILATGAGATVDNVITALQNLGLVKQS